MSLLAHLTARIKQTGPISLADYMADCLLHPEWGYYTTRDPFGPGGDFLTAPEISQMFGEMLGLCLVQTWRDQGSPDRFTLAEAGPGRGTLMSDMLRAARSVPAFAQAAQIILIEASPVLRAQQAQTLAGHAPQWIDSVDDLPDAPLFLVANEFFDALPIRQFQRDGDHWRERRVGLDGDRLTIGLSTPSAQPALDHRIDDTQNGDVVELCPAIPALLKGISARIRDHGGAAVIIDYGDWRSLGDTLQALRAHSPVDPLSAPGTADLTAHVDFEALTAAAEGCRYSRVTPQGVYLERLGITARAQSLAQNMQGDAIPLVSPLSSMNSV